MYLKSGRGNYTDLAQKMLKYRKPRKNASNDEYNLAPFFKEGHNITVNSLTALMRETGMTIDFFIDFEPGELPSIEHLKEIIRLKDELLKDKEQIIKLKDAEIEQWKKRYEDLAKLTQVKRVDGPSENT